MRLMVGRIVRSSTTRFAVGCETLQSEVPAFGCLVKVRALDHEVYGLIYDVRVEDDPYVRQLAVVPDSRPEVIEDQRRNRQVPIEVAVLVIGYRHNGQIYHRLPPQPPISLDVILTCDGDELVEFTQHLDYFRLVLDNRDLPDFRVFTGSELTADNAMFVGATGLVPGLGNIDAAGFVLIDHWHVHDDRAVRMWSAR